MMMMIFIILLFAFDHGYVYDVYYAETSFQLPPNDEVIKLRFVPHVDKRGTFDPPDLFYDGVVIRIGAENSHGLDYGVAQNSADTPARVQLLKHRLSSMKPMPTFVAESDMRHNSSGWTEMGVAAYYAYSDLDAQGKLSSDPLKKWKRVLEPVLVVAREFKQPYVNVWYPYTFGDVNAAKQYSDAFRSGSTSSSRSSSMKQKKKKQQQQQQSHVPRKMSVLSAAEGDCGEEGCTEIISRRPHLFTNIVRVTVPTHTGCDEIVSSSAVWLTAINGSATAQVRPRNIYQVDDGYPRPSLSPEL